MGSGAILDVDSYAGTEDDQIGSVVVVSGVAAISHRR